MKRLAVVLLPDERDEILESLRQLGVVHLDLKTGVTPGQEAVLSRYRLVQDALAFLGKPERGSDTEVPPDALDRVIHLMRETTMVEETIAQWTQQLEFWEPWGDFDPGVVRRMAAMGHCLTLYQVSPSEAPQFSQAPGRIDLGEDKTAVRFLAYSRTPDPIAGATVVPWPEKGPSTLSAMRSEALGLLEGLRYQAKAAAQWVPALVLELKRLQSQLDWEAAQGGVGSSDGLAYLTGWIPGNRSEDLFTLARVRGVAVVLSEPTLEDQPPTELKNSFFPRLMAPVFQLLGITPGYSERDISWPFFLFFSVFFGMILGDAAYGAILTVLGSFFLIRSLLSGGKGREGWILLTWLGLCTLVWGSVTGTWFAVNFAELPGALQALVPPLFHPLQTGAEAVSNNITVFCFTLGALQLALASLWNFVQMVGKNFWKALSHLGWFGLTFGLYLLVLTMVAKASLLGAFFPPAVLGLLFDLTPQGPVLPGWVLPLVAVSYLTILLMSFQEGRFLRGLGEGVANFLPTSLNAISAFADNISYIRLFAVGLAGYYIGVSFGSMAAGFGMDTPGGVVASVLILVFGHSLNLVMGFLSVIVHGIRLNVLEFSNRLGMEWSGRPYDPFRVKS